MANQKKIDRRRSVIIAMMGDNLQTLAEITSKVNISLPIVTEIIKNLLSENLVLEIKGSETLQAGRPPSVFKLNPNSGYTIGMELGRVTTNIVLLDFCQSKLIEVERKTVLTYNLTQATRKIDSFIKSILRSQSITKDELLGVGIAMPGIVNGEKGISETYFKSERTTIREFFENKLQLKVRLDHDVKSMVRGELFYGSAKNKRDSLYINYGWGLGVGIISDSKVFYGNDGYAGEFGHIPVKQNGELCYCGKKGCLETVASGRSITREVVKKIKAGADSIILNSISSPDEITPIHILDAANKGDLFSIEILENASKYLGIGLAILINIFNPKHIIIGGTMSQLANYLLDSIKNNALKHSLVQLNQSVEFKLSRLGNYAGALGVARLLSEENCYK